MIGKTRQQIEPIYDAGAGPARGVLRRPPGTGKIVHARRDPDADIAPFVAHYWSVEWDLRDGEAQTAETLPHPNVHLVFEPGQATISGPQTAKFSRRLEGKSQVFGVKFQPGGFQPFYDRPVAGLAGRTIDARDIFGQEVDALGARILELAGLSRKRGRLANEFFRARLPVVPDPAAELASKLVKRILLEPEICTVDELAIRTNLSKRALQRLFRQFVGISPKWVIRRYRLHEAVERIHRGEHTDLAHLAAELGYFDQAHLIKDFKALVGVTPGDYARKAAF